MAKKKIIEDVPEVESELEERLEELKKEILEQSKQHWDVTIDEDIFFFDPELSYELTGYRPITQDKGLDFDPEWFQQAKRIKLETGKYSAYPPGTKKYRDFWTEEYRRCNEGMVVNGYRITGDNYFFLNYYQLQTTKVDKAGQGRGMVFPEFLSKQYEYFHYVEMAQKLGKDVCSVKSRASGWSELHASLGVNAYTTRRNTHSVYTAFAATQLDPTLRKVWYQLDNLNANTEGGMKHVRQKHNDAYHKKASKINKQREELPTSWGSDIQGIIVDNPRKLRGDRIDLLFFEEAGSNPVLTKTYIQGRALVEVMGNRIGCRFTYGTGGDSVCMSELAEIFNNPDGFQVLPYKHNYVKSEEYVLTGFFVPSYTILTTVDGKSVIDKRGVTDIEKAKKYYEDSFNALLGTPKNYLREKAEFCFTPEDAFAFEGDNQFNTVLLAEQQAAIKLHKLGPKILSGDLEYKFKDNKHSDEFIEKVVFKESMGGKVRILEPPQEDESGHVPRNLYIAGIDGIDMGGEDTSNQTRDPSDFCVVIMKRSFGISPPKIVAIYKDRPEKIKTAHITCLQLLQYYNAQACLESTRISVLQFFKEKRCENKYLMRRPRACQSDIQNGRSKQFGAPATEAIIRHQLDLISNYIDEYCSEIWFIELIEELLKYSYENKRKFDIVAALGMAMLADEELMFVKPKLENDSNNILRPFGYYIDEYGIKRKGVIPQNINNEIPNYRWTDQYEDPHRIRTSNPMYYS